MSDPDPRFLGGAAGAVMTDTSKVAFSLVIDWDGACDMRANIDKPQAAHYLRTVADQLDPPDEQSLHQIIDDLRKQLDRATS